MLYVATLQHDIQQKLELVLSEFGTVGIFVTLSYQLQIKTLLEQ